MRLRVLIPAVENAVAGNAFRPGDVSASRKGLTVEIGNTDAEGRLILADALALADEDKPDLLIDIATLTGAARVALGPDLPPFYTEDERLAQDVAASALRRTIRCGACRYGRLTTSWLNRRSPPSPTRRRHVCRLHHLRAVPAALRRARQELAAFRYLTAGRRRRSRRGPRAANARPRARSTNIAERTLWMIRA